MRLSNSQRCNKPKTPRCRITESPNACGVQIRPHSEARETEAGITEEGCVLKEAHGFSFRREYHNLLQRKLRLTIATSLTSSVSKERLISMHHLCFRVSYEHNQKG